MSFTRRETLTAGLALPMIALTDPEANPPDPRGPITVPGRSIVVDKSGVQARGFQFTAPKPTLSQWQANWIGLPTGSPGGELILFRRSFQLDSNPSRPLLNCTADISYRIWVNGRLAGRGPADIGMDYNRTQTGKWFYDVLDLRPFLHRGANVISAEVFPHPIIGWEGSRRPGGFACELFDSDQSLLKTDASWSVIGASYWPYREGRLHFDCGKEPRGWRLAGFDNSSMGSAEILQNVWQPLVRSEIPARMETVYPIETIERASSNASFTRSNLPVTLGSDGGFTVKYDRVLPAYIGLTVKGGRGGTLILEPNEPDAPGYHRAASIALTGALTTVELPFMDSFSVINLRAVGLQEPLVVQDIRSVYVSQPVAYRGRFECSDPSLTRLWEVCRWATQICLQTHHLDSPHHQEPISDPGDYMIQSLVNYAAFHQPALTRQDLRKYGWILQSCENKVFHTSYALLWLQMLVDYHDHTGDSALVRELAPTVYSLLKTFIGYRGRNGLLSEAPNYMFMDWVEIAGFQAHHPPAVIGQGYMTAFFYRALADGMRVARVANSEAHALLYSSYRTEIAAAFRRELWSEEQGQFRDGKPGQTSVHPGDWLPADKEIETFSAHVNVLAVLYDLAPRESQAAILEKAITGPNFSCQPYFMHFVFEALAHAGLFERHAVEQMKRFKIVEETQSLREMWTVGDLSHGWGASPLHQLSTRVLGVRPISPGATRVEVAPLVCGLDWARGTVPTAKGDVHVDWRRTGSSIELTVTVPQGCTAEARLPGLSRALPPGRHRLSAGSGA